MDRTEIVIIGTGFAGLGLGVKLRELGIEDFVILEQANGVGGTWRANTYPGAACDVQSHLYSFSFEPNPRWSRMFAEQGEILEYLEHVADKYDIRRHIKFGCSVVSATWNDRRAVWTVTLADGRSLTCKALVAGTGGLSRPALPSIPGKEHFRGDMFHTAEWRHDVDLSDKRVAIIGTGASAIQVLPALAGKVKSIKLFQRTPPWIMPKPDRAISALEKKLFETVPASQQLFRTAIYWMLESRVLGFVVRPAVMEQAKKLALRYLNAQVRDPVLRAKLTPDYAVGCKRVLMSNDYFEALQRDDVELVTDGIAELRERSIATRDGKDHEVDVVVFATGFQVGDFLAAPFEICGRNGLDLNDAWRNGAEAYLGTSIAGFPNFFTISGPNTGLGHTSMVFMIEAQIQYISDCLRTMREQKLAAVDVKKEVQDRFNRKLHARMAKTIWATGGCKSWYQNSAGKNTALWPGSTIDFRKRTARFDATKYEILEAAPALETAPQSELAQDIAGV